MSTDLIPLLWDDGKVVGIVADAQGMLRPLPASDEDLEREIAFARSALRYPTTAPPFRASPCIDAREASALLDELERYRS